MFAGNGNDQMSGGAGNDMFVFKGMAGTDTITNFSAGAGVSDLILFENSPFADFTALLAATHNDGSGNTVIAHGDASITLIGVLKAQLAADDFLFA